MTQKGSMFMRLCTFVLTAKVLLVTLPIAAQAQPRPLNFLIGGGFTAPNSEVRDHLGDGYNFNIGVQVNVTPVIGIEGLYSFNGLGDKRLSIPVSIQPIDGIGVPTDFFADMNMQFGTGSLVVQKPDGQVRPYGLVGMGIYYRPITVSTPGVGFVPGYCDPWWYVCYPGGFVPVQNIVGERSSTDVGMGFGGGANFGAFFAEARYHYIWGPTIEEQPVQLPSSRTTSTTTTRKANGQFFVTTFGVRF
jgi:Outer membrane protein beta-barrel domain